MGGQVLCLLQPFPSCAVAELGMQEECQLLCPLSLSGHSYAAKHCVPGPWASSLSTVRCRLWSAGLLAPQRVTPCMAPGCRGLPRSHSQ